MQDVILDDDLKREGLVRFEEFFLGLQTVPGKYQQ
jgi:hypothetical protein